MKTKQNKQIYTKVYTNKSVNKPDLNNESINKLDSTSKSVNKSDFINESLNKHDSLKISKQTKFSEIVKESLNKEDSITNQTELVNKPSSIKLTKAQLTSLDSVNKPELSESIMTQPSTSKLSERVNKPHSFTPALAPLSTSNPFLANATRDCAETFSLNKQEKVMTQGERELTSSLSEKDFLEVEVQRTPILVQATNDTYDKVVSGVDIKTQSGNIIKLSHGVENLDEIQVDMKNDDFTNEAEEISTLIIDQLSALLRSEGIFGDFSGMVVAISSSIVSITTSLISAYFIDNITVRLLNIASVLTNLTSMVYQIVNYTKKYKLRFCINTALSASKDAYEDLKELVKTTDSNKPEAQSFAWLKPAIVAVVTVLCAGLTQVKAIGLAGMNKILSFIRNLGPATDIANNIVDWILETVCGIDVHGHVASSQSYKDFVERIAQLAVLPPYKFVVNSSLHQELKGAVKRAIEETSKKMTSEMSRSLAASQKIILSSLNDLKETERVVDSILEGCDRQETIMFIMEGPGGHGKSRAGKYLAQEVAKILGYNQNIYNLEKEGEYFNPYGGQDIAHIQELFNARVLDDKFISQANTIVSGDPCNLEGAALPTKFQPCRIKLIAGTTNNDNINLNVKLCPEAARAFWSRMIRVRITDPKFEGRTGQLNAHRKPDFSHLEVEVCTTTDPTPKPTDWEKCTFKTLLHTITRLVATKELLYMQSYKDLIVGTASNQIGMPIQDYEERIDFLLRLTNKLAPKDTKHAGNSFFVTRIQGPSGTMKTRLINTISNEFAFATGMDITPVHDFIEPPTKRSIYVIDDTLQPSDYETYLKWINKGNPLSIYLIGTNYVIEHTKLPFWERFRTHVPTYTLNDSCSSGVIRRIGLDAHVIFNGQYMLNDLLTQHTITAPHAGVYMIKGKQYVLESVGEYIFDRYKEYVRSSDEIIQVNDHYSGTRPIDLEISAPSFNVLKEMLQNKKNYVRAWMVNFKGAQIRTTPNIKKQLYDIRLAEGWSVGEQLTESSLAETIIATASRFRKTIPGASFKLTIDKKSYCLIDNILYMGNNAYQDECPVTYGEHNISCQMNGMTYQLSWSQYVKWEKTHSIESIEHIPIYVLKAFKSAVTSNSPQILELARKNFDDAKSVSEIISSGVYDYIKSHTVTKIIIGLIGITSLSALLVGVYKLFKKMFTTEKASKNADSPGSEYASKHLHDKFIKATMKRNLEEVKSIREQARQEGCAEDLNRFESDWRTGAMSNSAIDLQYKMNMEQLTSMLETAINEKDCTTFDWMWRNNPTFVMSVLRPRPQSLSPEILPKDKISVLEAISDKIRRNYVIITNSNGLCLALAIKGRKFVTVSHTTPDIGFISKIKFTSNGRIVEVPAKCTAINRQRDLAFYEAIEKIPEFKDITGMFTTESQIAELYSCTVVKGRQGHHTASMNYYPKLASKLVDEEGLWNCDEKIITSSTLGLNLPDVLSRGDCGTAIISQINNEWKIIGIHIGINVGKTFFSSITSDDLKHSEVMKNATSIETIRTVTCPLNGKKHVLDDYMISLLKTPLQRSHYSQNNHGLHVMGYNPKMRLFTNPDLKAIYMPAPFELTVERLPSATNLKYVTNFDKLVTNDMGKPDPLWTQCVNYKMAHENKGKWDQKVYDYVEALMTQKMLEDFGQPRKFTLYEVINGRGDCKQLPWTTSAGAKMKLKHGLQTKRPSNNPDAIFTEFSPGQFKINMDSPAGKDLLSDYQLKKDSIESGIPILIIVRDNAKVELLPAEDAKSGKVRLFSEFELADNMILKSYFGYIQEVGHARHTENDWQIGYNPYTDPIVIMHRMNNKPGTVISSDCKRLDKTIMAETIRSFVKCTQSNLKKEQVEALADSLIYVLHNKDGVLFYVDNGNESGSFVTVMLDCFALDFADTYALVVLFKEKTGRYPTLKEVRDLREKKILGDDELEKYVKEIGMTFEKKQYYYSLFNIHLTPAKTDTEYSFCSRDFIKDTQPFIYFPRLKKESILARLFYFEKYTKEIVLQNCSGALSEAAFWDEAFFKQVEDLVRFRLEEVNATGLLSYYPQQMFLEFYRNFVLGEEGSPLLQAEVRPNALQRNSIKLSKFSLNNLQEQIEQFNNKYKPNYKITKMSLTELNEYVQQKGYNLSTEFKSVGDPHKPEWTCKITMQDNDQRVIKTTQGTGSNKTIAKTLAAEQLMEYIRTIDYSIAVIDNETGTHYYLLESLTTKVVASIQRMGMDPANVDLMIHSPEQRKEFEQPEAMTNAHSVRVVNFSTSEAKGIKHSGDNAIEPAVMNQSAQAMATSAAVDMGNPQPTGVIPAMTTTSEPTNAAVEITPRHTLQPVGAPNMSGVGAITFDLKQLIYSQFLDGDMEYNIPSDAAAGTIVATFPYGPDQPHINRYIREYAKSHERYTGAIEFRFTVIGNPLYSGSVMVSWLPYIPTTNIVPVSELQKYAYHAEATTVPWNKVHILHDARQNDFYRVTGQDKPRPCLVIALFMSIQNPLKEDALVRVRVATKLQGADGANPFVFHNPVVTTQQVRSIEPEIAVRSMNDIFPSTNNQRLFLTTDGYYKTKNTIRENGIFYPPFNAINNQNGYTSRQWNNLIIGGPSGTASATPNLDQFNAQWPMLAPLIKKPGDPVGTRYFLGITMTSNMPRRALSKYARFIPVTSINGDLTFNTQISEKSWNDMKSFDKWMPGKESLGVVSIISNETVNVIFSKSVPAGSFERYGTAGSIKVVTNDGTFVLTLSYTAKFILNSDQNLPEVVTIRPNQADEAEKLIPLVPIATVDNAVPTPARSQILPSNYRAFRMSEILPSSITFSSNNFRGPTMTDNSEVLRYFQNFITGPTECVQFQILHKMSQRVVATVRYQDSMFVINQYETGAFYFAMPWTTEQLSIINEVILEKTQLFPTTSVLTWLDRTSPVFAKEFEAMNSDLPLSTQQELTSFFKFEAIEQKAIKQAAAILGGLASGVGQGLSSFAQMGHEKDLKNMGHLHEKEMQGNMFQQQHELLDKSHGQQSLLQGNQFDFEKLMQSNFLNFQNQMFDKQANQQERMASINLNNSLMQRGMTSQSSTMLHGGTSTSSYV